MSADQKEISLKEYFERIIEERDARYLQMFKSAEEAVTKAEVALKEYKIQANEFRGTLTDQAQTFMPRAEAENRFTQHAEKIRTLELSERAGEGGTKASAQARVNSQWVIGLIVGLVGTLIGVFVATH